MKTVKAMERWAVIHPDGTICTHGGIRIYRTKRSAKENSFPNGRVVRVQISEVPAKKGRKLK